MKISQLRALGLGFVKICPAILLLRLIGRSFSCQYWHKKSQLILVGLCLGVFTTITACSSATPKACDPDASANPNLSCGEKILLLPPGVNPRFTKQASFDLISARDYTSAINILAQQGFGLTAASNYIFKKKGFDRIATGDYAGAIPLLEVAWKLTKDPETSIALENAKLASDEHVKVKTIAVVIPATQTPIFVPTSILKGVAAAQFEWNQDKFRPWKIRIVIANDANDPSQAKAVVTELLKRPDILAVVGHYSSQVTGSVQSLYQQAKTVLISGTSTATELTAGADTYFFRTCSSNQIAGMRMAQTWAKQHQKIAIFYTPGKKFSESIRGAFLDNLRSIQVVKEFSLSNPAAAKTEVATAKQLGATGIVLFPDAYTDPIERDRVLAIIKANDGELPILGNEIIADDYLFKLPPKQIDKLTISLPWHPSDLAHHDDRLFQHAPNWWGKKDNLSQRIVMSYDATQVLLAGLDKLPLEMHKPQVALQQLLSQNFSMTGMTGKIQFKGSDRAEPINSLVRPICNLTTCQGFQPAY